MFWGIIRHRWDSRDLFHPQNTQSLADVSADYGAYLDSHIDIRPRAIVVVLGYLILAHLWHRIHDMARVTLAT